MASAGDHEVQAVVSLPACLYGTRVTGKMGFQQRIDPGVIATDAVQFLSVSFCVFAGYARGISDCWPLPQEGGGGMAGPHVAGVLHLLASRILVVLLLSVAVNYTIAGLISRNIANQFASRGWLWVGILLNLGALGYFKYFVRILNFASYAAGW